MSTFVFKCLLLCALMSGTVCCMPKNYTLRIEKNDCAQCVAINTTICSGYCYTQDTNLRGRFGRKFMIQRSCLPLSLVYQSVHIPGCPDNANPHLYYPAAYRCSCKRCDTRAHHCVRTRRAPHDRCTVMLENVRKRNDVPKKT